MLPLFVRGGSIVPSGSPIDSTAQEQKIVKVRVYPGVNADFTLYDDDGKTYSYEQGTNKITHLHWDDAAQKLTQTGARAWTESGGNIVEVIGR